jgi:hypothetical protein
MLTLLDFIASNGKAMSGGRKKPLRHGVTEILKKNCPRDWVQTGRKTQCLRDSVVKIPL